MAQKGCVSACRYSARGKSEHGASGQQQGLRAAYSLAGAQSAQTCVCCCACNVIYPSCTHLQLTAFTETFDVHACIHPIRCRSSPRMVFSYLSLAVHGEKKSCSCQSNTFVLEKKKKTFLGKTKISFSLRVRYVQPECHVLAVSIPSLT